MYWVLTPSEGLASRATLQASTADGWTVVIGLCVVLAGSAVIAWRRRTQPTETTSSTEIEPTPTSDVTVLTDEERVHRLLESNGGRMHQTRIVEETEWSKSKVSMLLSRMETEGSITKLRIGRQNIISHPGFEPDATRSPVETGI